MLVWLLNRFSPLLDRMELYTTGDSRVFLTARTALASVTGFALALLLGPFAIRWLKVRFCERVDSDSERLNELQFKKNNTPTMGGLFIVAAVVIAVLLWGDLGNRFVQLSVLTALGFAALGAVDDWIKLSSSRNGLRARTKFVLQLVLSLGLAWGLYDVLAERPGGLVLIWPIGDSSMWLGSGFVAWAMLVLVGSSNAVNLTDGLDGLASGCMVIASTAFAALCYLSGHSVIAEYLSIPYMAGCGELTVVMGGLVGAMLGFLWFNCHPAQVFMGDTGSLPIGALLGMAALVTRQELLLVVVGGVFVVETLSVILQVVSFRLLGRRVIACSPLHNHLLFRGENESKIVVRFWIGSVLLAVVAVASLKVR
ncbi:MAG: phospho-N-acetylmuramoyl-pentapeptide-transferase [Planctomycetaceae bacterium]|jgi:phospho-N-acetylmuramoyl-pentapeptide-transferase|nr:phospho-N-acetylmuramoyl-pentapeptide-transferase [Planctomycetaceae bacterium]MDP7277706.1 phospho-N-acetylmuramoyl-pentapeptide-transferase [Planctomycetaceae bacterium]